MAAGMELDHATTVLVVEDDSSTARMIMLWLRTEGFRVRTAIHGAAALSLIDEERVDIVIVDLEMPVMDGPSFVREMVSRGDDTPIVLMSGSNRLAATQRALGLPAALPKPVDLDLLVRTVRSVVTASAGLT